jgi:hypothetical protein
MAFDPLKEKGIPIEKQFKNWRELNIKPYDKKSVHPYTQARVILMNGIEVEAAIFKHQFARVTPDAELKRQLSASRRAEQQQQKIINWLVPGDASTLETTIGYEQVAVDLTAFLARTVPDSYVKQVFDFGLLEDFDHLYRYANLMQLAEGKEAEEIVKQYTEVVPGRPTMKEHRHPFDEIRKSIDRKKADPKTILYILTLVAGEQQTMNYYMNQGNRFKDDLARGLYLEIAQIEEQHVSQYESLLDARASWFEMSVMHEYNECYLYYSFMNQEPDSRIKNVWETHLAMEIEHLKTAVQTMEKMDKKDAAEILPSKMPDPIVFESNIEYVRDILESQVNFTAKETHFVPVDELEPNHRYFNFQNKVNGNWIPSEEVIFANTKKNKHDYRLEIEEKETKKRTGAERRPSTER